jgi:hypothetical protein
MRRRLLALALTATLLGAIAVQPAQAAVVIKGVSTTSGFKWQPRAVWKSVTGTHTVTSWKGAWSKNTTIGQGAQTSFTFQKTGVFKFRCLFHSSLVNGVCSGMCGKVVVG